MLKYKKNTSRLSKKTLVITSLIVVAIIGLVGVGAYKAMRPAAAETKRGVNSVDYSPPTEQELAETEAFKKNQQNQQSDTSPALSTDEDGLKKVTPVISFVGQYDAVVEASAFIPGIFEDGGTCKLTLTKGNVTVVKTGAATKDAKTTRCVLFSFPSRELKPTGKWTAVVEYLSSTAKGMSERSEFEVK